MQLSNSSSLRHPSPSPLPRLSHLSKTHISPPPLLPLHSTLRPSPLQAVACRSSLSSCWLQLHDGLLRKRGFSVSRTYPAAPPNLNAISTAILSSTSHGGVSEHNHIPAADLNQRIEDNRVAKTVVQFVSALVLSFGLVLCVRSGPAIAATQVAIKAGSSTVAAGSKVLGTDVLVSGWMGLMAGCLHTLTGPDHLAALAPLSIGRTKLESVAVGALWGVGHDAGQVIFGILFLLLKDRLHIEVIRTWGARVVGLTLLTIGALGIKEAQEIAVPCLAGDGSSHTSVLQPDETLKGSKRNTGLATFATGIVHGLQPDALVMILPALALPSRFAGAAFLGMFLLGTVLAMGSYTAFIGSCSVALQKRVPRITEHLSWGSSLIAIFVGAAILAGELFGASIF